MTCPHISFRARVICHREFLMMRQLPLFAILTSYYRDCRHAPADQPLATDAIADISRPFRRLSHAIIRAKMAMISRPIICDVSSFIDMIVLYQAAGLDAVADRLCHQQTAPILGASRRRYEPSRDATYRK